MTTPVGPEPGSKFRRQGSWPLSATSAVVYVRSDDSLYLDDVKNVQAHQKEALQVVKLPRKPWKTEQAIYGPNDDPEHETSKQKDEKLHGYPEHTTNQSKEKKSRYLVTVKFDHADPRLRIKRAIGSVRHLYVFENPLSPLRV